MTVCCCMPKNILMTSLRDRVYSLESIITWMSNNKLKLNVDKTEALVISSPHKPCLLKNISLGPINVEISEVVRNLGSWFDCHLTLAINIKKTCSASF